MPPDQGQQATRASIWGQEQYKNISTIGPALISVPLLEQREGAVEAAAGKGCRAGEEAAIQLGEARQTEEAEHAERLILEDLERAQQCRLAASRQRQPLQTADPDRIGAERDRLHDVRAAVDAAV